MDLNKEIKKIILESGMSERAFCEQYGLSYSTVNKVTTKNVVPSVEYFLNFMILTDNKIEKSKALSLFVDELHYKLKHYNDRDFVFTIRKRHKE